MFITVLNREVEYFNLHDQFSFRAGLEEWKFWKIRYCGDVSVRPLPALSLT